MPTTTTAEKQAERAERAREALESNSFCIVNKAPGLWLVQNGDKQPYDVRKDAAGRWSCTCPDYQGHRGTLRCKHIEAIRLTVAEQQPVQIQKEALLKMDNNGNNSDLCGGWVKLWHPAGVQVTLPVPPIAFGPTQAQAMFTNVSALIDAGFMVNLPGLEEGEKRETVTHIVRRRKAEDGGGSTPVMDIYTGGNFRILSVYLDEDKPELVAEFIDLFGPLSRFKVYPSNAPLERGKDAETDREYVTPVSDRGVQLVYKTNPKYDEAAAAAASAENKAYKVAKRVFVRFERGTAAPANNGNGHTNGNGHPAPAAAAPTMTADQALASLGFPPDKYGDGTPLGGGDAKAAAAEKKAFERYFSAEGKSPASKQALRDWIVTHPAL
jgi:hypothetical protein